jgi:hypothetical protein
MACAAPAPGSPALLCVDWGKHAAKRAVYAALPGERWTIRRERPEGEGWTLPGLLDRARLLRDRTAVAVLVGIDAVLGLPARHARRPFLESLLALHEQGSLDGEIRPPFFAVPKGKGSLGQWRDSRGGDAAVRREIERLTGAKSVFIVSGIPGTVGSGSRALWRELAPMLERGDRDFALWPFEGKLEHLIAARRVVLAESYPRAAYAVALSPALPARLLSIAKTRPEVRALWLAELAAAPWLARVELRDLDAARASEDDFDAMLTAAALVRLLDERRPLSCDLVDPRTEGGILPTGGIAFARREAQRS